MKVCVGAFLFREGRVLLGLRSQEKVFYPGAWDVIGGHVEPQESIPAALVRELTEEIQVTPIDFVQLATLSEIQPAINGEATYHIFLVTRWDGGDPAMRGNEHSEIRWFPISEAVNIPPAHPGYIELLRLIGLRL
jgi:8-oxo-dGTP pyrophosphatase MutT (NUDIX family)